MEKQSGKVRKMKSWAIVPLALCGLLAACSAIQAGAPAIQLGSPTSNGTSTQAPSQFLTPLPSQSITLTAKLTSTPPPSPMITSTATAFPTAEGISVSTFGILNPKISPASEIIDGTKISSFFLQHAYPDTIALDGRYVYWVDHADPRFLYRVSRAGGEPEVVAQSLYKNGRLDCFDMQSSLHWLIFCDADTPGIPGTWNVRAINLDSQSQTILFSTDDPQLYIITSLGISLRGNSVIWAVTTQKNNQPDENIVTFVDLDTGEKRELQRQKVDTWGWSSVSLSGNQAVIQQSYDETKAGLMLLHLLNVTTGKMNVLLTGQGSWAPGFSFPWVLWAQHADNEYYTQSFIVYNLADNRKWRVPSSGTLPSDPKINGSWVYWRDTGSNEGNSIFLHDIEQSTTYVLNSPGPDQMYDPVYMLGDTIAWVRNTHFSQAISDHYLEWTTIR